MERSGEAFDALLAGVRDHFPDVASQVEEESRRGRPVPVKSLPPSQKRDLSARVWEATERSERISGKDLTVSEYTDDEKLALLVAALHRLGSSMASSREAVAALLDRHGITGPVRFRREDVLEEEESFTVVREAPLARQHFEQVAELLESALERLR